MRLLGLLRSPEAFRPADRRVITLMAITGVIQGFAGSLLTTTLPYARLGLGVSESGMSLVLAVTRIGSLAALPLSAHADRYGRRRAFLASFLLLGVASGATAAAPEPVSFALVQGVARAATVALSALAAVLLAEILSPGLRAFGISFYAAAGSVGGGVALILLPLADRGPEGWRTLFALTVLGLLPFPLLARTLRESPIFRPRPGRVPLSRVARRPYASAFWRLAAVAFLVGAFSAPAIGFALERLINDLGWTASAARSLLLGGGLVGASGLFVGGRLADTWGRRPTTVVSLLLGLAGGLGVYWFEGPWLLSGSVVTASFGSSAFVPAFTAHRAELFPTPLRATAAAWLNNAGILGSLVSFTAGFVLFDRLGLPLSMTVLAVGVLISAGIALTLEETRGRILSPD